jgi:DNA polymerase-3 subunit alpha
MEYLEPLGLIKMDILGLVNLTTIDEALKLIKINQSIDIDLSRINLQDQKVFKQLASGDTIGIFQLESPGMRKLIVDIKPTSIEDISITSALFRPGPQQNIPTYLSNKANAANIEYLNDDVKEILQSTYNVIIYQEQVIQIVQRVGNYSLAQADLFRRAISKKNAEKLSQLEKEFIIAAEKNHYSKEQAQQIYDYVYKFANYGFNHSHSLAYSYISYYMAYLKAYYPLEYFTVLLSSSDSSVDKISLYVQAARAHGLKIAPPSINDSLYSFTTKKNAIIFGLNAIKGIGRETINKILAIRNMQPNQMFKDYLMAITSLANNTVTIKVTETLIKAGAFDGLLKDKTRG